MCHYNNSVDGYIHLLVVRPKQIQEKFPPPPIPPSAVLVHAIADSGGKVCGNTEQNTELGVRGKLMHMVV